MNGEISMRRTQRPGARGVIKKSVSIREFQNFRKSQKKKRSSPYSDEFMLLKKKTSEITVFVPQKRKCQKNSLTPLEC